MLLTRGGVRVPLITGKFAARNPRRVWVVVHRRAVYRRDITVEDI